MTPKIIKRPYTLPIHHAYMHIHTYFLHARHKLPNLEPHPNRGCIGTPGDTRVGYGEGQGGNVGSSWECSRENRNQIFYHTFSMNVSMYLPEKSLRHKKRLCHTTQCSRGMGQERTRSGKRVGHGVGYHILMFLRHGRN